MPKGIRGRCVCSVDGCEATVNGQGLCGKHQQRWKRTGDPLGIRRRKNVCSVDECPSFVTAHGYCTKHLKRWKRHGDPLGSGRSYPVASLAERVWSKTVRHPGGCWEWQGFIDKGGYGRIWIEAEKTMRIAHRIVYELLVEPIPEGLHLDHLCRVRHCVNPLHLEPVTPEENMRRGLHGVLRNVS